MQDPLPKLRVEIRKLGNKYVAVTRLADGETVLSNEFQHDPTGLTYLGPLWLLDRARLAPETQQLTGARLKIRTSRAEVAAYGWRLYHYLFGSSPAWPEFLSAHPAYQRCSVTLAIAPEAKTLWRLPWEYLYDGQDFPCLTGRMLINRCPVSIAPEPLQATSAPLRMLVVVSEPEAHPPFDGQRELHLLEEAVEELIRSGAVEMDVLENATSSALRRAVQHRSYHLIHYVGHGIYSLKEQQGFLCLESATDRSELVNGAQLLDIVGEGMPHLWVISACPSAQIGILNAFEDIAHELMVESVPHVLSIASNLPEDSGQAFFYALYEALSRGDTVLQAVHRGRLALHNQDVAESKETRRFDWGVPEIYQCCPNQRLVRP